MRQFYPAIVHHLIKINKYLLLLIGLAAITAGSAFFVAPELSEFHEGRLKGRVGQQLGYAGYTDFDLKMNNLHAEKITIRMIADAGDTEEKVKQDVVEVVRGVYGATADKSAVNVIFEYAAPMPDEPVDPIVDIPTEPEVPEVIVKVEPKSNPMQEPMQDPKVNPNAGIEPTPDPDSELEWSSMLSEASSIPAHRASETTSVTSSESQMISIASLIILVSTDTNRSHFGLIVR